jgi:hypothetical protein
MHHGEFRPGINPFDNGKGISTFRIAVLTILGTLLLFTGISASSDAATRNVAVGGAVSGSCTGTPCDLNWAISVADPADTVSLANGTYNLGNIQVPKELHFVGASPEPTAAGQISPANRFRLRPRGFGRFGFRQETQTEISTPRHVSFSSCLPPTSGLLSRP